jgi:hypothetical protein
MVSLTEADQPTTETPHPLPPGEEAIEPDLDFRVNNSYNNKIVVTTPLADFSDNVPHGDSFFRYFKWQIFRNASVLMSIFYF